ncbi:MAG: outer membrane protein assembly factor BamA [Thermodesulfovibrionales bacterium]|nr:outer membrane protein assembly factor BamA [Thermodesulfovibrionales bacterium]
MALAEILNSGSNSNRATERKRGSAEVLRRFFFFAVLLSFCSAFANAQSISHIEVTGLYSISEDEIFDLLNIKKGETLNRIEIKKGIKRAFLKGIFDDIIVESLDQAGSRLKITIIEKKIIDSIDIRGNDYFSDRFIKNQLHISSGERLNNVEIKKGLENLKTELKKRGFINSDVTYEIVELKNNKVKLLINLTEGQPEIIKRITISEPEDAVKSYISLSEGDIFDILQLEKLKEKVADRYKKEGFIGTNISYSYKDGTLDIKLYVGKRLNISFAGNASISSKELIKEVPFFKINDFNDELLEESTLRILSLYHKYGYPFVQAAPTVTKSDNDISIEFFIFEGERYLVDLVVFVSATGALSIPSERLSEILFLKAGGYYNPDVLKSDRETITEFYHALGYIYVNIQEPEVTMDFGKVQIKFSIEEGSQIKLAELSFVNNRSVSVEDILNARPLKVGTPYNEIDLSDARRKILHLYNKKGFLDAEVTVNRHVAGSSANITFNIKEGHITFFGSSVIAGNEKTDYRVIKREFMHKNDQPLDYGLLLQERQKLHRLGLFADIEIKLLDKESGKRDVLYDLKEGFAGAVEFGFGYAEYERYRGFIDISYKNLWGMHRQASFRTELSALEQRFMLSYQEPWFMNTEMTFRATMLHEKREEKSIDTDEIRYKLKRNTASAGVEKRFTENLKTEFYYDFSVVETFDVKPDVILSREDTGTLVISGLRPGLIYDTRDNPFEPKDGLIAGLSFKVASAVFLSETDFAKLIFYANKYSSVNKHIVLAVSLRGGLANGFGRTEELPIVERFFLGGRTTVRGYAQDTLGPKGADGTPTGGNAFIMGNLELRADVGKGFGIVTFLDGGNVWQKIGDMNMKDIKYTTGLGLRYNTPVGPLRVDYGHKLNKEAGESSGEIHFSIGHAF